MLNTLHCPHYIQHGMASRVPVTSLGPVERGLCSCAVIIDRSCYIPTYSTISHPALQLIPPRDYRNKVRGREDLQSTLSLVQCRRYFPQVHRPSTSIHLLSRRQHPIKHSDLGIFPPPTPAPITAAHRDGDYTPVTSTCRRLPQHTPIRACQLAFPRYTAVVAALTENETPLLPYPIYFYGRTAYIVITAKPHMKSVSEYTEMDL